MWSLVCLTKMIFYEVQNMKRQIDHQFFPMISNIILLGPLKFLYMPVLKPNNKQPIFTYNQGPTVKS